MSTSVRRRYTGGMYRRARFLPYLFSFLVFAALFATLYWKESLVSFLPLSAPTELLLYGAIVLSALFMFTLWRRESEQNALQYSFLTTITHRFRTPLSGISWAVGNLHRETTIEERQELVQSIANATERLTQVVDTLTGLARFDNRLEYAFEAVSLRELVDESLRKLGSLVKEHGVTFSIEVDPRVPRLVIDRQKIQFVSDVLLDNAIRYSSRGGAIAIHVGYEGDTVTLSVEDQGIGLTWGEKRQLFKSFFRGGRARAADPEGMGLSLPLVRTVVRTHGGTVEAHSRGKNKGAMFVVRLPIAQQ